MSIWKRRAPAADQRAPTGRVSQRDLIAAARRQAEALQVRIASNTGGSPEGGGRGTAPLSATLPEDAIPGYQLVEEVHRGGQGVVYRAVQKSTQRRVAIKVMRDGPFASPGDRARFEREVYILGQLRHPNIVTIHESGRAAGCDYFVMDYVAGRPLDAHVESERLSVRERLALFAKVCEAVAAAHVRGIIHRDLKPANIRVDSEGEPRVLDFGLAKAEGDAGGGGSGAGVTMTLSGQFIGSLPWAAPEQVRGETEHLDMRTDVYALGVTLHQILTGRFPYDISGSLPQVVERILTQAPAAPSETARRSGGASIDADTDTIVLRCLNKDPDRRYQTAGDLAGDLRHALAGEPIDARRDSLSYVMRKQLVRYRRAMIVGVLFAGVLVAGLVGSLVLWRQAEHHRKEAVANLELAQSARKETDVTLERARREAQRAVRVRDMIADMFRVADPRMGGNPKISALDMLNSGAQKAIDRMGDDPVAQSDLLSALGDVYLSLSEPARARDLLERALELRRHEPDGGGPKNVDILASLAQAARGSGDKDGEVFYFEQAYQELKDKFAENNLHVAIGLLNVYMSRGEFQKVEPIARELLERPNLGHANNRVRLGLMNMLGRTLMEQGRVQDAIEIMRNALAIAERDGTQGEMSGLTIRGNLAALQLQAGELEEAEKNARAALEGRIKVLPPMHVELSSSEFTLGEILAKKGDNAGALAHFEEALRIRQAKLPASDPRVKDAKRAVRQTKLGLESGPTNPDQD